MAFGALAGCSDETSADAPTQLSDFRDRAAQGAEATYSVTYTLAQGGDSGDATVAVAHTPDSLRLDITTKTGVATSITTPSGAVACQKPDNGDATCIQVAAAGQEPPAAFDPGLRDVFTSALSDLGQGFGTVEVVETPTGTDPEALCARVTGNDVPTGLYCLLPNGLVASADFTSGTLALSDTGDAPDDTTFSPPATPRPLQP